MSSIDELLSKYCPGGVEYKTLGELGEFYGGLTGKSKNDFKDGNGTFISYRNVYSNPALDIHPLERVKIAEGEKQRTLQFGDVIFTGSSETPDECGFSSVVTEEPTEPLYLNSFCFFFRMHNPGILLPDFAKHLFRSGDLRYQIGKTASGVTRFNVSKEKMRGVEVPVPPIEVQREIVRVLDQFTQLRQKLSAELSAELTDRKKQYEYYRDELLPFNKEGIEWKTLGDICTIVRGASPRPIKNFVTNDADGVNWIKIGDVRPGEKYITSCAEKITTDGAKKSRVVKPGDFILSNSMSFGRPYILKIEGCIHDGWLAISDFDEYVTPDYLYHILVSNYIQVVMAQRASFGGAVQNLNADIVRGIEIPIVSKEEQIKIVKVLDNFSVFCTDISSGLPAEIEARQKQYEYYRDKLLSFKRKETA